MTNSIVRHVGPPLTGALPALGFACLQLRIRTLVHESFCVPTIPARLEPQPSWCRTWAPT
jgi:hypothetical protein